MCKKTFVVFTSVLLLTTSAYGNNQEKSVCPSSCEKSCCNIPKYFNPCRDKKFGEFIVKADFLYWQSELRGLDGAFGTTSLIVDNSTPGIEKTTLTEFDRKPDFEWRPGFKVGAYFLAHCFNMDLFWTHIHGHADYHKHDQHGKWKLRYDTIDLNFGYNFFPCCHFLIKPFIGVRGANIHQMLNSHLTALTQRPTEEGTENTIVTSNLHDKEEFFGIGPQVGVEGDWYLGKNFSLYGIVDWVTYYGNTNCDYDDTDSFTATLNIYNWNKRESFNCIGFDGVVGLRWDMHYDCCCKCCIHYSIKLGVEEHRICDFSNLGSDGALSLAGGFAEASIGIHF